MAAPGVFPKLAGDTISADDYNVIQTLVFDVKTTFLLEPCVSSQVAEDATVTESHWNDLKTDIDYCVTTLSLNVGTITTKIAGYIIRAEDVNLYYTNALTAFNNKAFRINLVIAADTLNYNLSPNLVAAGYSGIKVGRSAITLTVNNAIVVGSTSTSIAALVLNGTATGDSLTVVNNGYIVGRGGTGGDSASTNPASSGTAGGPAMRIDLTSGGTRNLVNNGTIGGGGGGGGSAGGDFDGNKQGPGGSGGGGAGRNVGVSAGNGFPGTLTTGGAGGPRPGNGSAGGGAAGGNLGVAGGTPAYSIYYGTPGTGGAAGSAIVNSSGITITTPGTILGVLA